MAYLSSQTTSCNTSLSFSSSSTLAGSMTDGTCPLNAGAIQLPTTRRMLRFLCALLYCHRVIIFREPVIQLWLHKASPTSLHCSPQLHERARLYGAHAQHGQVQRAHQEGPSLPPALHRRTDGWAVASDCWLQLVIIAQNIPTKLWSSLSIITLISK